MTDRWYRMRLFSRADASREQRGSRRRARGVVLGAAAAALVLTACGGAGRVGERQGRRRRAPDARQLGDQQQPRPARRALVGRPDLHQAGLRPARDLRRRRRAPARPGHRVEARRRHDGRLHAPRGRDLQQRRRRSTPPPSRPTSTASCPATRRTRPSPAGSRRSRRPRWSRPTVVAHRHRRPDAVLLNRMTLFDIVDPATFGGDRPSGTGPFKVTAYKPGTKIELTRNDDVVARDRRGQGPSRSRRSRTRRRSPARCARATSTSPSACPPTSRRSSRAAASPTTTKPAGFGGHHQPDRRRRAEARRRPRP